MSLDTYNVKQKSKNIFGITIHLQFRLPKEDFKTKKPVDTVSELQLINIEMTFFFFCLPANDKMRHGHQEGSKRHQDTSNRYDLGSVELRTKIAHKGNHQQIPYRVIMIRRGDGEDTKAPSVRPPVDNISNGYMKKHCSITSEKA